MSCRGQPSTTQIQRLALKDGLNCVSVGSSMVTVCLYSLGNWETQIASSPTLGDCFLFVYVCMAETGQTTTRTSPQLLQKFHGVHTDQEHYGVEFQLHSHRASQPQSCGEGEQADHQFGSPQTGHLQHETPKWDCGILKETSVCF